MTMTAGWVAVLDSDWGDFKGPCAIDISSYIEYEVWDEKNLAIHGTLESNLIVHSTGHVITYPCQD